MYDPWKLIIKHQLISSYWGCSPFNIWPVSFYSHCSHFPNGSVWQPLYDPSHLSGHSSPHTHT